MGNGIGIDRLLKIIGVSSDMPTLSKLAEDVKRSSYYATCDSNECRRLERKREVRKRVPKSTVLCKECGHALFWRRE